MKKAQFLVALILLCIINLNAQSQVKKGPPDLSGNWVKKEDGVVKYHYKATQVGNQVKMECVEDPSIVRTFYWDEPGNYILNGTKAGVAFQDAEYKTRVHDILKGNYLNSYRTDGSARFYNIDGIEFGIVNYDDDISCTLCDRNSFALEEKLEVSTTLKEIKIYDKDVHRNISLEYWEVSPIEGKSGYGMYTKGDLHTKRGLAYVTAKDCCRIYYDNYFSSYPSLTLTKVASSW